MYFLRAIHLTVKGCSKYVLLASGCHHGASLSCCPCLPVNKVGFTVFPEGFLKMKVFLRATRPTVNLKHVPILPVLASKQGEIQLPKNGSVHSYKLYSAFPLCTRMASPSTWTHSFLVPVCPCSPNACSVPGLCMSPAPSACVRPLRFHSIHIPLALYGKRTTAWEHRASPLLAQPPSEAEVPGSLTCCPPRHRSCWSGHGCSAVPRRLDEQNGIHVFFFFSC